MAFKHDFIVHISMKPTKQRKAKNYPLYLRNIILRIPIKK